MESGETSQEYWREGLPSGATGVRSTDVYQIRFMDVELCVP